MKLFFQRLREAKGFTLVELMVVVAIIGVLSAVAIPNFRKYQAKSKTSEAKLQLASIYTAEKSFLSDFDGYAGCLSYMGYNPSNEYWTRYYTTGISGTLITADANVIVSNGALTSAATLSTCTITPTQGSNFFQGGKPIGSSTQVVYGATTLLATHATELGFTAGAEGAIDKNYILAVSADAWTIDSTKAVKQVRLGY